MQALRYSFFLFSLLFLWPGVYLVQAQSGNKKLVKADSLYAKEQFTEAFQLYEELLTADKVYSPAMLLKMALVKESLEDYTAALYYLNLYYQKQPSRNTLKKMEALANRQNLKGYEYSDYDFFATQARKYYLRILEILMMAAVTLVTINLIYKLRGNKVNRASFISYLLFIGALFYYLNFLSFGRFGIVNKNELAFMSGPSAGSTLLRTLPKGNRLKVQDKNDIWIRVEFNDTTGYVRKEHLLMP